MGRDNGCTDRKNTAKILRKIYFEKYSSKCVLMWWVLLYCPVARTHSCRTTWNKYYSSFSAVPGSWIFSRSSRRAADARRLINSRDPLLYVMRLLRCALQNWSSHAVRTPILLSTRRQFANEETVDEESCRRGGQCRLFGIDRRGDSSTRKQLTRSNVDEEST